MPQQRQREVEDIARGMLLESVGISAAQLGERARMDWFTARDFLRRLERNGQAIEVADGRFGQPVRSFIRRGRRSR